MQVMWLTSMTTAILTMDFHLYMNVYKDAEFGTMLIRNAEGAEIKNVKVYFKAAPYMASNFLYGKARKIRKGQT